MAAVERFPDLMDLLGGPAGFVVLDSAELPAGDGVLRPGVRRARAGLDFTEANIILGGLGLES